MNLQKARPLAYATGATYAFTFQGVQDKAPNASGVYTIYTAREWVYVGESDDMRQRLFDHLNEPDACLHRFGPLSFSFELVPAARRAARQQALVIELEPSCNR